MPSPSPNQQCPCKLWSEFISDTIYTSILIQRVDFYLRVSAVYRPIYTCYGNVAGWLAGWLVTLRYCIKTAKPV